MSVITDGVTITGDGTSTQLATISVADITALQAYNGPATVVHVADPLQGGVFYYTPGNSFNNTFTYAGATITAPTGVDFTRHDYRFVPGQVIVVEGTSNDGTYVIETVTASVITTSVSFVVEKNTQATISVFPYSKDFTFAFNAASRIITITDPDPDGNFLTQGFGQDQVIVISGTCYYNSTYTIDSVTKNTIVFKGLPSCASSLPAETAHSTLTTISVSSNWMSFTFSFNATTKVVTIANPANSFIDMGFHPNQVVVISGTCNYNGTYTINTVTVGTITLKPLPASTPALPSETIDASITEANTSYASTFSFYPDGGTAVQVTTTQGSFTTRFKAGQVIQVFASDKNNGLYTIDSFFEIAPVVTGGPTTYGLTIASAFPKNPVTALSTVTAADNGTTFPATANTNGGYWQRQYDPKDGLSVTWFGAKGDAIYYADGVWYTKSTSDKKISQDDTLFIQAAITAAMSNKFRVKKVVIPPGQYLHSTIYIPTGLLLTGSSIPIGSPAMSPSKLIIKKYGGDSIRVGSSGSLHTTTVTQYWNGGVTNLDFYGDTTNLSGWAISMRDISNTPIALEDMNFFENLHMRRYPQGGMELTIAGSPINIQHIRGTYMNGPVIYLSGGASAANFDNISADHSPGGAIWIYNLSSLSSILINNLKAEGGYNGEYKWLPNAQMNPIRVTHKSTASSSAATIMVNNAIHTNTAIDVGMLAGNPTITKNPDAPVIVNLVAHGLLTGNVVTFFSTGILPANVVPNQPYYVLAPGLTVNSFQISTTPGGAPVTIKGCPIDSGTHILYANYRFSGNPIITQATIGVINLASHKLLAGDVVKFFTTGSLPTLIIANQPYYVLSSGLTTNTFEISDTPGGTPIDTTGGSNNGTHFMYFNSNYRFLGNPAIVQATAGIIKLPSHGLSVGSIVKFFTTGQLPTNIIPDQEYYVLSLGLTIDSFTISTAIGGTPVNTLAGSVNGTQLLYAKNVGVPNIKPGDFISVETVLTGSPATTVPAISIANPTVVTFSGHGLVNGDMVKFFSTGMLPTNLTMGQIYYVVNKTDTTFQISSDKGGRPLFTTGIQSGVHSIYKITLADSTPKITWDGILLRVRPTDIGVDPQMISLTNIPYPVTKGMYNVTEQFYNSKVNVGIGTVQTNAKLTVGGEAVSNPAWTTVGINISAPTGAYTDTTSAGIVPTVAVNSLSGGDQLNAAATTYTDATTLYIGGPPVAGTANITNAYGLISNGLVKFPGKVTVGSTTAPVANLNVGGNTLSAAFWGTNGINLRANAGTYTDSSSTGTVAAVAVNGFVGGDLLNAAATYTDATTLYIGGPPAAGTAIVTNAYSLISNGLVKFPGKVAVGGTAAPAANFNIGGNAVSAGFWGNNGINLRTFGATYTDTTSGNNDGDLTVIPEIALNSFAGGDKINSVNAGVTYTDAATLYIKGSPVVLTDDKTKITNSYALITRGMAKFLGFTAFGSSSLAPTAFLQVQGAISASAWTTNGIQLKITGNTITDTTSTGTIPNSYLNVITGAILASKNDPVTPTDITITDAASLFISAPVKGANVTEITNAWALKLGGAVKLAAGTNTIAPLNFVSGTNKATWATGDMGFGDDGFGKIRFVMVPSGTTPKRVVLSNDATPAADTYLKGNGTDYTITPLTDPMPYGSGTTPPTIDSGHFQVFNDGSGVKLWANNNGTLVSVALS